jgi:hypothetical protein
MPENGSGEVQYVTMTSPDFGGVEGDPSKLLNGLASPRGFEPLLSP